MTINKEGLRLWITALRSGEYKQTRHKLQDKNGYCCIGIACRLFIPSDKLETTEEGYIFGALTYSQPNAPQWLLDINEDFAQKHKLSLAYLNDIGKSFAEIADLLEKYYLTEEIKQMTPAEFLIPRWLVLGNWPGREKGKYEIGDIITDNGNPKELPIDQNGKRRFRLQWEECPCLFQKLQWWEERDEATMETVKYLKNIKRNQYFEVLEMVPAFSIDEEVYSFKAKNRRGQTIVGYIDLTEDYIPITEEEYKQG